MKNNYSVELVKQIKHKKSLLISNEINELSKKIAHLEEEIRGLRKSLQELRDEQANYKKNFYSKLTQLDKFSGTIFVELDLALEKYDWKIDGNIQSINSSEEQLVQLQQQQQLLKNQFLGLMRKLEKYDYLQSSFTEIDGC